MLLTTLLEPFQFSFMVNAMLVAAIVAIPCALLSVFLVLKGWALMGDAMSHAVFPGVVVAYIVGIPFAIGAFVAGEKVEKALVAGDHGSTYGGNPLATAAANVVFDMFESRHILDNVNEVGAYLGEKLASLVERYDFIKETRGLGLMRGLEFTIYCQRSSDHLCRY